MTVEQKSAAQTGPGRAIYEAAAEDPGSAALQTFLDRLAAREVGRAGLLAFFASMTAFVRHITPGIPSLAARLSDALLPIAPYRAHGIAAHVLGAAIDEYGFSGTKPHAELLRDFAAYFGLTEAEIEDPRRAVPAANGLGAALFAWYRQAPVPTALGVHAASEVTGYQEAQGFHRAFLTPPKYGLSAATPAFAYVMAHLDKEADHSRDTVIVLDHYLALCPGDRAEIDAGASAFMAHYQRLFEELTDAVFG
jgi:hypothetical protein